MSEKTNCPLVGEDCSFRRQAAALQAENTRFQKLLTECRDALRPFAHDDLCCGWPENRADGAVLFHFGKARLQVGDFKRVRNWLGQVDKEQLEKAKETCDG